VREADGLAMSSRNGYLTTVERKLAPGFHLTLCEVVDALHKGRQDYASLQAEALKSLESRGFLPDYVEIRRAIDLLPATVEDADLVVLGSAWLGKARLIDNIPLTLKKLTETS
jgi:pantoate--beta-alanine ligase